MYMKSKKPYGRKNDQQKNRWDLLPVVEVEKIVKVLTSGAAKYEDWNWQSVDNMTNRYYAAMMRHLIAWRKGEILDAESGESHLAHAGCCLLFIMWKDGKVSK